MITKKINEKVKKSIAILTMSVMSTSAFAPILVQSSYTAFADDVSTTTSTSTNTTTNNGSTTTSTSTNNTTSNGTSTGNGITVPTPPTPPTFPNWWFPGNGNGTTTGTSTPNNPNPWWPPFPWGNGTSTGTGTGPWWQWPTPPTPPTPPSNGTTTPPTNGTSTASTTASTTYQVFIYKYVDGTMANASSSMNMDFPMSATYNSTSTGSGSGTYNLSASGYNGDATPYRAITAPMTIGGSYTTYEVMGTNTSTSTCAVMASSTGSTTASTSMPFSLVGYTWGNTLQQAQTGTPSMTMPSFSNMMSNKYVIVWNDNCATSQGGGQIGGDVTGGATSTASSTGVLHVDSIETVNSSAVANGTYENGWKYIFNITVPTNEANIAMKFSDWVNNAASSTIAVANNMRISSQQAAATSTVTLTAANSYSSPFLNIIGDLDPNMVGKQIKVLVEMLIPVNSVNGSYSTTYGVKSQ